eukprot:8793892-Pyramimonas_sp.AAC.1
MAVNLLNQQKESWATLEDGDAAKEAKDKAAATVLRSPLEMILGGGGKVVTCEQMLYQLFRASGFNNKPGRAPRGKLVRLVKNDK